MKRTFVFDSIDEQYTLGRRRQPAKPIAMQAGYDSMGRVYFWLIARLEFGHGQTLISSVAPDMKVLSISAQPEGAVTILRDDAGRFWLRKLGTKSVTLKALVSADAAYFDNGAGLVDTISAGAQSGHDDTHLPPRIARKGRAFMRRLELSPRSTFREVVWTLVRYFRSFREGELPHRTGDLYETLMTTKLGVCRHRAMAFLVSARTLGIPTRVVHNDAHAFVEVRRPNGRWLRIDLGRASPQLSIDGMNGGVFFEAPDDHLPTPDVFRQSNVHWPSKNDEAKPNEDKTETSDDTAVPGSRQAPNVDGERDLSTPDGLAGQPGHFGGKAVRQPAATAVLVVNLFDGPKNRDVVRGGSLPETLSGQVRTTLGQPYVGTVDLVVKFQSTVDGRIVSSATRVELQAQGQFEIRPDVPPTISTGLHRLTVQATIPRQKIR